MNLYTIVFSDDKVFRGGDLINTRWQELPNKGIRSIFYSLSTGDALCLANFKRIYHYVEGCKDLMGKEKGKLKIEYSHLIIERNGKYLHYKIDQKKNDIIFEELEFNSNKIQELNPLGWKKGNLD